MVTVIASPAAHGPPCTCAFASVQCWALMFPAAAEVIASALLPVCACADVPATVQLVPGTQVPMPPSNPEFCPVSQFVTDPKSSTVTGAGGAGRPVTGAGKSTSTGRSDRPYGAAGIVSTSLARWSRSSVIEYTGTVALAA